MMTTSLQHKRITKKLKEIQGMYSIPFDITYHQGERMALETISLDSYGKDLPVTEDTKLICKMVASKYPEKNYSDEFSMIKLVRMTVQGDQLAFIPHVGNETVKFIFKIISEGVHQLFEELEAFELNREEAFIISRLKNCFIGIFDNNQLLKFEEKKIVTTNNLQKWADFLDSEFKAYISYFEEDAERKAE